MLFHESCITGFKYLQKENFEWVCFQIIGKLIGSDLESPKVDTPLLFSETKMIEKQYT